jgi:hypothetical protein
LIKEKQMKKKLFIICVFAIFLSCSKSDSTPFPLVPSMPLLTTSAVTSITTVSARCGGNVSSDGGATVTVRGFCWGIASNPSITGNHSTEAGGTGSFHSNISGLTPAVKYYVRAYATNSVGTSYGNEVSFKTNIPIITLPVLTTSIVTAITSATATCGGNISVDGGAPVTARGVCWSTSINPIATGNHTTDSNGTGSFISSLTGLSATTTYYVRAYATNSEGTAYGNEVSFTTL